MSITGTFTLHEKHFSFWKIKVMLEDNPFAYISCIVISHFQYNSNIQYQYSLFCFANNISNYSFQQKLELDIDQRNKTVKHPTGDELESRSGVKKYASWEHKFEAWRPSGSTFSGCRVGKDSGQELNLESISVCIWMMELKVPGEIFIMVTGSKIQICMSF